MLDNNNLKMIFESSHINLLIGAGLSNGAFNTLEMEHKDNKTQFINKYFDTGKLAFTMSEDEFWNKLMENWFNYETYIDLLNEENKEIEINKFKDQFINKNSEYANVQEKYKEFFKIVNNFIKQKDDKKIVNVFTSNYDMLINESLHDLKFSYNDAFYKEKEFDSDTLNTIPTIRDINGKLVEIPHYNLVKFHGSLDWTAVSDERIEKKLAPYDNDFVGIMPSYLKYNQMLFSYTYYALINKLKEELAIENSVLFVLGFSMRDEHIKKIISSALNANPCLVVIFVSYGNTLDDFIEEFSQNPKFKVLQPSLYKDTPCFDLENIIQLFKLKKVVADD